MSPGSVKKSSAQEGFTLPELIVVLAGLGMLTGLVVIPAVTDYLDYARVDEAKSLLNSAAADCLQGFRRKGEGRLNTPINDNIISFTRLKNTGYVFKDGITRSTNEDYLPNCSTVLITAAQEADRTESLPDLGFTIAIDGTLTKIAVNSGSKTKSSAESWAGKNTTEERELIEWQELNSSIIQAKASCKKKRDSFAKSPGIGRTKMWDPIKTSKCTTKPPKFEDAQTCTANGCTKDVYYIDGEICGYTPEAFEKCRREKTTAACQAEKNKKISKKATTQTIEGDRLPNCAEPLWFYEGEDVGSAQAWKPLMCERNKKALLSTTHSGAVNFCDVTPIYICGGEEILKDGSREDAKAKFDSCLDKSNKDKCTSALNTDAAKRGDGGPFISPTPENVTRPIPIDAPCGLSYWYCTGSGKIHRTQAEFDADQECKKACPSAPGYCDMGSFLYADECRAYNKCKGRIP